MILRPRQALMVERCQAALRAHGNTLGVAIVGAGKTIMLSALAGSVLAQPETKACILAHRDELTDQNRTKFARVNPGLATSVFNAQEKSWAGRATFAMVQTLSREAHLRRLPALDLLVIDEAHHVAADSYRRVVDAVRDKNPAAQIFGVTATPTRGDGRGLRAVFSNVADQITLRELICSGHLVPPRTFVIDVGKQESLRQVRQTAAEFDMNEVAAIMNSRPINEAVVRHWQALAGDRKTIVFCSTVAHAEAVVQAFQDAGIPTVLIHGELPEPERKARLRDYEHGDAQVVVNVAVLTEGYDYTPTACVVLLRPSSHRSTLLQMIGRGLRIVDPHEYPSLVKTDCLVLDFGTATLTHGALEQAIDLTGELPLDAVAPTKVCPDCEGLVPLACLECPFCGHAWPAPEEQAGGASEKQRGELRDFAMTEIDLLNVSNFLWCDLFQDGQSFLATGFEAWAGVFCHDGVWHAVGSTGQSAVAALGVGDRLVCLAQADDFLNTHETEKAAHKSRRWLHEPATENQLRHLPPQFRQDLGLTRYRASALLSFRFNHRAIRQAVGL
ncbi:DEAD/DEAH box helicase [Methylolobus aquaticus]|nr:DEAD/DEAH box helicase [Methylolobus aquaticus]